MLRLEDVKVSFGDIPVLRGISLEVKAGTVTAVVGSNNAGKSTILRAISGLVPLSSGRIFFHDDRVDHLAAHQRSKLGITLIPEGRQLFPEMTVRENIMMGGFLKRQDKDGLIQRMERVLSLFPTLADKLDRRARTLSGGEQQMVSMGRGLMSAPKLLLIDEPSLGLAPVVVEQVFEIIEELHQEGFSILLVEQNLQMALSISQNGYVIENGMVVLTDTGQALLNDEKVRERYLGI